MALIVMKPVHWNSTGYQKPSGHLATSGYPKDHGFGHEEWNNSPQMAATIDGVRYRAFCTEPIGDIVQSYPDRTVVFMYANHDGVQVLVGVAAKARWLSEEERAALDPELGIRGLWKDCWAVPLVRSLHGDSKSEFRKLWNENFGYMPHWICPEDHWFWLPKPMALNSEAITGKSKLLTMFSRYTKIGGKQARAILSVIPANFRNGAWNNIWRATLEARSPETAAADTRILEQDEKLKPTTRQDLIAARVGQGRFRTQVLQRWGGRCAVTGCTLPALLRASHLVPWSEASNKQRLDSANGIALTANLDALFDRWLISFDRDGSMVVAPCIPADVREMVGVPKGLSRVPDDAEWNYFAQHRACFAELHGK